jgi:catechol 2,3-dioxygenase-like lactoylglutathione lyase family enzyme
MVTSIGRKNEVTPMTTNDSTLAPAPAARPEGLALRVLRAKVTSLGMRAMNAWARARHKLRLGLRISSLDHVTIPCGDLLVAEAFYVGVLGARVLIRIDEEFLRKLGRPEDAKAGAVHTSVVFSGGPRLDLFLQPDGQPPPLAGHPHHAFAVSPWEMLRWRERLHRAGVPTFGPTRLGPPGQASLYSNDPFGNHLEIVTHGFVRSIPVGPPDMGSLAYTWRGA